LPALEVWGTGQALREFMFVDDLADGLVFLMQHYSDEPLINIGTGTDLPIADLATMVCEVVGFRGMLRFDTNRPDGTPRKVMDVSRLTALGWTARTSLREGLEQTYRWYVDNIAREQRPAVA
jgi:GDP-L-fucose synthase